MIFSIGKAVPESARSGFPGRSIGNWFASNTIRWSNTRRRSGLARRRRKPSYTASPAITSSTRPTRHLPNFVFFARRGELVSNRREDHEVSMLSLHLLQNCMVYINTLMLQQVLAQPKWADKLTPRDLRALTPLIWDHVNPYGRFELDMNARLPLQ